MAENKLCVEHTKQIVEISTKLDLMHTDLKESKQNTYKLLEKVLADNDENTKSNTNFYKKLVIACFSVLGTVVLAAFGITKIIPLF
jgi:hypothetical protein